MNFYIVDPNKENRDNLRNLIEADYDSIVVGTAGESNRAYSEIIQLHIDILIINYNLDEKEKGLELINKLKNVGSRPRFLMICPKLSSQEMQNIYDSSVDLIIASPLNLVEARQMIRLISSYAMLLNRLNQIYEISSSSIAPYTRSQALHREQTDHIAQVLRFLGIAAEAGIDDIMKICNIMCDQNIEFSQINFERDLHITEHDKRIIFQRIRRSLKVGISNLANMCIDYPENDILFDYANNLFEYRNIHSEMRKLNGENAKPVQISLQHFFNGLLQESYRVKK